MILQEVLDSPYCKTALLLSVGTMIVLLPKTLFHGFIAIPALLYVILFSLNITCLIRQTKERSKATPKNSVVSFIATIVGITTLSTCGISAPMCGATLGMGLFSTITPHFILPLLFRYSAWFLIGAIGLQLYSLYRMQCLLAKHSK